MYTVEIERDGKVGRMFTLDLEGVQKLLEMATPLAVTFRIQKVS